MSNPGLKVAVVVLALTAGGLEAGTVVMRDWTGETSPDWFGSSNWDPVPTLGPNPADVLTVSGAPHGRLPLALVLVEIGGDTGQLTVRNPGVSATFDGGLYVGSGGDGSLRIELDAAVYSGPSALGMDTDDVGDATVSSALWNLGSDDFVVGVYGAGVLDILAHGAVFSGLTHIGGNADSEGTVTVNDSILYTSGRDLSVGWWGTGTLQVEAAGSVTTAEAIIGANTGSRGDATVTGADSSWDTGLNPLTIGRYGAGTLMIADGGVVTTGPGTIGEEASSTGNLVTVTGDDSTWDTTGSDLYVGWGGAGSLRVEDGGSVLSGVGIIAGSAGTSCDATISGGTWATNGGELAVGLYGYGTLRIEDGGVVSSGMASVGGNSGGDGGEATVNAAMWHTNGHDLRIGWWSDGSLNVEAGGVLFSGEAVVGANNAISGDATVTGSGSSWNTGAGTLTIGNRGYGVLTIADGATVTTTTGLVANDTGSTGIVTVSDATWANSEDLRVGEVGTGQVDVLVGGLVMVADEVVIGPNGTINVYGGTLRLTRNDALSGAGTLNLPFGTLAFDRDMTIPPTDLIHAAFGDSPTISPHQQLEVMGAATLATPLTLDGGTLTVAGLANPEYLQFDRGTFNLTGDDLVIGADVPLIDVSGAGGGEPISGVDVGPGGVLGSDVTLGADQRVNVTDAAIIALDGRLTLTGGALSANGLINYGVLAGAGRIEAPLYNDMFGEVRIAAGEHMVLTAGDNANAGRIEVIGGEIEFTQDLGNAESTSLIAARDATLRFTDGLANSGAVAFSFGTSDVFGDIANAATGSVVVSGDSRATFYDDVANAGSIHVAAGSTAVFFGGLSGNGTTGAGTVFLEGDTRPGFSPGEMSFGGDVCVGPAAALELELAGAAPGQFDRIVAAGDLALGGTLEVLLAGYTPTGGDTFDVLDWANLSGTFATVGLPPVGPILTFSDANLYTSGELTVISQKSGDADFDGDVDLDDFVALKKNFATGGTWAQGDFDLDGDVDLDDFVLLKKNFATAPVPEPASSALLALGGLALVRRKR